MQYPNLNSRESHTDGPVDAVLFDLDDTLFDHRRSARQAVERLRLLSPALHAHPFAEVARMNLEFLDEIHGRVLAGEIDPDEARIERMGRLWAHFGEPIPRTRAREVAEEYRRAYAAERSCVPGAPELLRELRARDMRLAVVTNNLTSEQEEKMERLGLAPLVDALVASESVGSVKPEARIFQVALERIGALPGNAVMVGDSWSADVLGAIGAGVSAVWFNPLGLPAPDPEIPLDGEINALEPAREAADAILAGRGRRTR